MKGCVNMEHSSRVRVSICGKNFTIVSDEGQEHIVAIADDVNNRMSELIGSNSKITYDMAAVLTALNLSSELKTERMLNSIKDDLDSVDALDKKLQAAESCIAELKKINAEQQEEFRKEKERMRLDWIIKEKEFLDMIDRG
ncbi:MAG: cell division protein ZapA [Eubacteriales bacterium]|nr:cell division protein ZapA [Eubacteriales bacterium]